MKTKIIAVTGASGSGKSLFTQTVYGELLTVLGRDELTIIKEDSYYKAQNHLTIEERAAQNYDHPDAFEHDLLIEHLDALGSGNCIFSPQYCFNEHNRKSDTVEIRPTKVIIVEGILLLSTQKLLNKFDIKIYMDTPLDLCFIRRMIRDKSERGRDADSVIEQYIKTVRPMFYEFIQPQKTLADILVNNGGKNRVAIELLKSQIMDLVR